MVDQLKSSWMRSRILVAAVAFASMVLSVIVLCGQGAGGGGIKTLSQESERVKHEYVGLERVHADYEAAKQKLESKNQLENRAKMEEERLATEAKVSKRKVNALRLELEDKMKTLAGMYAERKIKKAEDGEAVLSKKVRELQQEVKDLAEKEEQRQKEETTEQKLPATGKAAVPEASFPYSFRNPNKPVHLAAAVIAKEGAINLMLELEDVTKQLHNENKHICELCAQSSTLSASRPETCNPCSTMGDADANPSKERLLAEGPVPTAEEMDKFVEGWKTAPQGPQTPAATQGLAAVRGRGENVVQAGVEVGSALESSLFEGAGGLQEGREQEEVGSALESALFGVAGGGGHVHEAMSKLVEVDKKDGDAMPVGVGNPAMKVYYHVQGTSYLLGVCDPSPDDIQTTSHVKLCSMCKNALGERVVELAGLVDCECQECTTSGQKLDNTV